MHKHVDLNTVSVCVRVNNTHMYCFVAHQDVAVDLCPPLYFVLGLEAHPSFDRWPLCVCMQCGRMEITVKGSISIVLSTYPMSRMCFGQYQALPAALGDRDHVFQGTPHMRA